MLLPTIHSCQQLIHLSMKIIMDQDMDELSHEDIESMSREDLVKRVKELEQQLQSLKSCNGDIPVDRKVKKMKVWKTGKPFEFDKYNKRHIALKFLYLGWDYQGYVTQDNVEKTIEDAMFKALSTTRLIESRDTSNYHRCGRTDIGVSAFSQIISIDIRSKSLKEQPLCEPEQELNYPFLLNRALPPDIQCISWAPVHDSFSARFDCIRRSYRYFFPRGSLNIERMREASTFLVGEHDFKNFCKEDTTKNVQKTTVKKILSTSIFPTEDKKSRDEDPYDMFIFEIVGHGFLWHQIRCIMSVLFLVGEEKEDPSVVVDLLNLSRFPDKPQYQLASGLPLILYQCDFADDQVGKWIGDDTCLTELIENLQSQWSFLSIKSHMIHSMLKDILSSFSELKLDKISNQHDSLSFEKSKNHKLLSLRPVCKKKSKEQ